MGVVAGVVQVVEVHERLLLHDAQEQASTLERAAVLRRLALERGEELRGVDDEHAFFGCRVGKDGREVRDRCLDGRGVVRRLEVSVRRLAKIMMRLWVSLCT